MLPWQTNSILIMVWYILSYRGEALYLSSSCLFFFIVSEYIVA